MNTAAGAAWLRAPPVWRDDDGFLRSGDEEGLLQGGDDDGLLRGNNDDGLLRGGAARRSAGLFRRAAMKGCSGDGHAVKELLRRSMVKGSSATRMMMGSSGARLMMSSFGTAR